VPITVEINPPKRIQISVTAPPITKMTPTNKNVRIVVRIPPIKVKIDVVIILINSMLFHKEVIFVISNNSYYRSALE